MRDFGGMVSFLARGGEAAAVDLVARTDVFTLAESLGAVESLIEHPGRMTHASAAGSPLEVPGALVRLSVGIETADDLVADLRQALDTLASPDVENSGPAPSQGCIRPAGPPSHKENTMAKYLLLKHYRGAPAPVNDVPMDQWTPDEVEAHIQFMNDFAARLEGSGEFIDGQALSPDGVWVRSDGEGRPPVTDGPFAETKDLIAGWMVIDVDSYERAIELAGELSAAPGAGGEPIHEWLEVRPFLTAPPTVTQ